MGRILAALFASSSQKVDELAVGGIAAILGLIAWQGWAVAHGHPFDPQGFGVGACAILGGMGGGVGLRDKLGMGDKLGPAAPPPPPDPGDSK